MRCVSIGSKMPSSRAHRCNVHLSYHGPKSSFFYRHEEYSIESRSMIQSKITSQVIQLHFSNLIFGIPWCDVMWLRLVTPVFISKFTSFSWYLSTRYTASWLFFSSLWDFLLPTSLMCTYQAVLKFKTAKMVLILL